MPVRESGLGDVLNLDLIVVKKGEQYGHRKGDKRGIQNLLR